MQVFGGFRPSEAFTFNEGTTLLELDIPKQSRVDASSIGLPCGDVDVRILCSIRLAHIDKCETQAGSEHNTIIKKVAGGKDINELKT